MEVIQLESDDDDFIQSINPAAPRKSASQLAAGGSKTAKEVKKKEPITKKRPPISTRIESDPILKPPSSNSAASSSASPSTEDECPMCGRSLKLLNEQRRTLHLNSCLDSGEAKADHEKCLDKWASTMDCPVCSTPLAAGPFRSAHIKKCGREHAINGKDLLKLVNTQEKVADNRRKRALPHTSAKTPVLRPKKVSKLEGEPKSLMDEDIMMAKALSASMMEEEEKPVEAKKIREEKGEWRKKGGEGRGISPQFTRIINENIRKRRSYAVVELAPRSCKCDVIELIQSRFLRVFRARRCVFRRVIEEKKKENEEKAEEVKKALAKAEESTVRRAERDAAVVYRVTRLDTLSWAYRNLAVDGETTGDVRIECTNGEEVRGYSWALRARTTALRRMTGENLKFTLPHPAAVVRHWLQYVCCAKVEWASGEDNEVMRDIARLYGPEGLSEECVRMTSTRRELKGFELLMDTVRVEKKAYEVEKSTVAKEEEEKKEVGEERTSEEPVESVVEEREEEREKEKEKGEKEDEIAMDEGEEEEEGEKEEEDGQAHTVDSEGSLVERIKTGKKKEVASSRREDGAHSPPQADFLAELRAQPVVEILEISVSSPAAQAPPRPRKQQQPKVTVTRSKPEEGGEDQDDDDEFVPRRSLKVSSTKDTVDMIADDGTDAGGPLEATSMDESDAIRNILDVSCLQRSPTIRVSPEAIEGGEEKDRSPELFDDDDNDEFVQRFSQKVPSPSAAVTRSSPQRRSIRQSITEPDATVTPTTSRRDTVARRSQATTIKKKIIQPQDVIYIDDTPVAPRAVSKISKDTVAGEAKPDKPIDSSPKKEEESTVDQSFLRGADDAPSYGRGGMDMVDESSPPEDYGNDDFAFGEDQFQWNDDDDDGDYAGGGEIADSAEAAEAISIRAQEEVDSFLASLRFNETSPRNPNRPSPQHPAEVDSFLLSLRILSHQAESDDTSLRAVGDILAGLSPVRREDEEKEKEEDDASRFKTPSVRGGRGRGGARGRGRGAIFGSNVKVLKWSNVTPRPQFEAMDDGTLKAELTKYGLRAMGKKRAVAMLSEIYEKTHPVIDDSLAAAAAADEGPSASAAAAARSSTSAAAAADGDESEENDGEKTLNRGADSSDDDEEKGGATGETEESILIPTAALKGVDAQLVLFLEWLRTPSQADLYDHVLALKSISLEELEVKLKRADSAICGISRKVLMVVLDRLHITYSLPQDGWKRKRKG